ncbi:MAG: 4'-phosphopantetheinyl transferase superfamily protein [Pseudomonadota bacterium]
MVRVFAAAIGDGSDQLLYAELVPLLSPRKRERVESLVHSEDVVRTLMGERLIRGIIKREIGIEGAAVRMEMNAYGKPFLAGYPAFHFNLSHSGKWVVCAVAGNPVGIDVERMGEADHQTAAYFFSAEEREDLSAKPVADRQSHFHHIWALKESFLKCTGKGFYIDPVSFTIKIEDDGIRLRTQASAIDARYCFKIFDLDCGYALAVCSEGEAFAADVTLV